MTVSKRHGPCRAIRSGGDIVRRSTYRLLAADGVQQRLIEALPSEAPDSEISTSRAATEAW
jgi:hypothetical protein